MDKSDAPPTEEVVVKKPKHPGGRPTKYTVEVGQKICDLISKEGRSIKTLCSDPKYADFMPHADSSIWEWKHRYPEFSSAFDKAKLLQMEVFAEQIVDISDNAADDRDPETGKVRNECVNRSNLRVRTRQWLLERLLAKKYGANVQIEEQLDAQKRDNEELRRQMSELIQSMKKEY